MGELDQDRTDQPVETPSNEPRRGFWASFGRSSRPQAKPGQDEQQDAPDKSAPTTNVGRLLQETRESRRISLDEAERTTRIRSKYLAALESGAYQELPTPNHIYGFLRSYAVFLGLDWQEVEALYRKENPTRHFDPGIFHPENIALTPRRRPMLRAELVLILVVMVVVVVIGGWAFWKYGRPLLYPTAAPMPTQATATATISQQASTTRTPTTTSTRQTSAAAPTATQVLRTVTPTPEPPTPTPAEPTATTTHDVPPPATSTATPTETPLPTPASANGVTLAIKVIERAWVQVTIDGQEQPGNIFEADQEQTWEAQKTIYFICGNAGGVEITVNGQALGLLGRRAEVVEKLWTPQGEATPTPKPAVTPTPTPASGE
ncbi:MAG: helix-turn-helix domain-containing protein [Anaerolineae bacterium]|nr:helix-turn-helix domain-containing protein [Anaerolineae bacterium]